VGFRENLGARSWKELISEVLVKNPGEGDESAIYYRQRSEKFGEDSNSFVFEKKFFLCLLIKVFSGSVNRENPRRFQQIVAQEMLCRIQRMS
jgi:hypothetical protein